MPRYAEASADVIYKGFCWVFGSFFFFFFFFADALPRQTEKFWNGVGILLPTYLAPEFRRLWLYVKSVHSANFNF